MLATRFLQDRDQDQAISELIENLRQMVLVGQFRMAAETARVLAEAAAWRPFVHGSVSRQLPDTLELVFALADLELPATAASPALTRPQLQCKLHELGQSMWRALLVPVRMQQQSPAGQGWSGSMLAAPILKAADARQHLLRWWDAEFVLKARLQSRCRGLHHLSEETEDVQIAVADEALALPAGAIADYLLRLLRVQPVGYSEVQVLLLAVVDSLLAADTESAEALTLAVLDSADGARELFWLLALEPVREWMVTGVLAEPLRVSPAVITAYQQALHQRPVPVRPAVNRLERPQPQVNEPAEIEALLENSAFASLRWKTLKIERDPRSVLVAAGNGVDLRAFWWKLRELRARTGRVPVLTMDWMGGNLQHLFAGHGFDTEAGADDCTVEGVLARAATASVDEMLQAREQQHLALHHFTWEQITEHELECTRLRCGRAPDLNEVLSHCPRRAGLPDRLELERWLLDWELTHGGKTSIELAVRQQGFSCPGIQMLLLPTLDSWEALAWMHWYGAEATGSAPLIKLGRSWQ